ncbi:hypothetical protein VNI00_003964 [Paramarasmius palmivorus]|uniref:WW domain-containing protein n=1 Tax=Paramarasmius palmivorus TaxID=297713 RepID=A0AAW0DNT5_9AGAR
MHLQQFVRVLTRFFKTLASLRKPSLHGLLLFLANLKKRALRPYQSTAVRICAQFDPFPLPTSCPPNLGVTQRQHSDPHIDYSTQPCNVERPGYRVEESGDQLHPLHEVITPDPEVVPIPESDIVDFPVTEREERGIDIERLSQTETCIDSDLDSWWERVIPVLPVQLPRYSKTYVNSNWNFSTHRLDALTAEIATSLGDLPEGWQECIETEGSRYFYHREENIITGSWMYDTEQASQIHDFIVAFQRRRAQMTSFDHNLFPLVLWLAKDEDTDSDWQCYYYCVNKKDRTIFWLEKNDVKQYLTEVRGGCIEDHTRSLMECEYWTHVQYFHVGYQVTKEEIRSVSSLANHALVGKSSPFLTNLTTSKESAVTQTSDDLKLLRKIISDCKTDVDNGGDGHPWIVGRLMHRFCRDRYLNFYGQRGARLGRLQSVYGEDLQSEKRSPFFNLVSLLCWGQPSGYFHQIGKVTMDDRVVEKCWDELISRFRNDWTEHITHATILLAVNVSFLDVPTVVSEDDVATQARIAQIAVCLSTIFSLGTVILGLSLVRNYRMREHDSVEQVYEYLRAKSHSVLGHEKLAIIYSLPFVFLLWG